MQPRQLRVGDLVDDYCPRERRLSNHAIVALVGEDVRQVRCTTCDAEHEYKGGKVPASRKKKPVVGPPALAPAREAAAPPAIAEPPAAGEPAAVEELVPAAAAAASDDTAAREEPRAEAPEASQPPSPHAEISLHRRLIRATLPRVESEAPARPIPEFTMHRAATAHGHRHGRPFRPGQGGQHRPGKGGFGPGRQGQGEVNGNTLGPPRGGQGQRSGHGAHGAHGGRGGLGAQRGPQGGHGGPGGHATRPGQRHPRHGFGRGPKKH
jgi:hypothetical protein